MLPHWILDEDGEPKQADTLEEWAKWHAESERTNSRRIEETDMGPMGRVSTVFLAQDHSYMDGGPPLLFESMVFGGPFDQAIQERYSTRREAELGHQLLVNKLVQHRDELLEGMAWGDDPELRDKALETVLRLQGQREDWADATAAEIAAAINKQNPDVQVVADGDTLYLKPVIQGTMGSVIVEGDKDE